MRTVTFPTLLLNLSNRKKRIMKKINKDDVVQHNMFGIGKVLDANNLNKISVFFADEGPKLLDLKYAKLKILTGEEANHPELDNLETVKK